MRGVGSCINTFRLSSRCLLHRRNILVNPCAMFGKCNFHIVIRLQTQPEFRAGAKVAFQAQRGVDADRTAFSGDVVDSRRRHTQGNSECVG